LGGGGLREQRGKRSARAKEGDKSTAPKGGKGGAFAKLGAFSHGENPKKEGICL